MCCIYKITTFFLANMQMEYIWAYLTGKWVENNAILCYYPVYREIRIVWSFIEILCVNIINSNSLFTHCLRKSKKKAATKFVTAWFPLWTSLGLNQGPPDYENDKMIFCDSLLSQFLLKFNQLRISLFPMELTKSP